MRTLFFMPVCAVMLGAIAWSIGCVTEKKADGYQYNQAEMTQGSSGVYLTGDHGDPAEVVDPNRDKSWVDSVEDFIFGKEPDGNAVKSDPGYTEGY